MCRSWLTFSQIPGVSKTLFGKHPHLENEGSISLTAPNPLLITEYARYKHMNRIEYVEQIARYAREYRVECVDSVNRNKHMNDLNGKCDINQKTVDAVLVDFINKIAVEMCIDYGMYTKDFSDP